jgi:hypothetical protein
VANLKYYNETTEQWESLVIGQQGPGGPTGPVGPTGPIPTSTTPGTVETAAIGLGYMGIPRSTDATTTGSYTIQPADAGEHIYASATRTIAIPANVSVPLPIGTTVVLIAGAGATITITIPATDTMLIAGSGTGGAGASRTLAPHGVATIIKTTSTLWYISGNGLT